MSRLDWSEAITTIAITIVIVALITAATLGALAGGRNAAEVRKAHIAAGHIQCRVDGGKVVWTLPESCLMRPLATEGK